VRGKEAALEKKEKAEEERQPVLDSVRFRKNVLYQKKREGIRRGSHLGRGGGQCAVGGLRREPATLILGVNAKKGMKNA